MFFVLAAGLGFAACATAPVAAPGVKVEVAFREPEKFTDVKTRFGTDAARDATLAELRDFVQSRAAPRLPADTTLSVTVTDIDRAGEFEPWRGATLSDTRFIRTTYPPRIELEFVLRDASGAVLSEGKRTLSDINFQMNSAAMASDESLRHEKALIGDWVRKEFRGGR